MSSKQRVFTLALTTLVGLSALAGCGSQSTPTPQPPPPRPLGAGVDPYHVVVRIGASAQDIPPTYRAAPLHPGLAQVPAAQGVSEALLASLKSATILTHADGSPITAADRQALSKDLSAQVEPVLRTRGSQETPLPAPATSASWSQATTGGATAIEGLRTAGILGSPSVAPMGGRIRVAVLDTAVPADALAGWGGCPLSTSAEPSLVTPSTTPPTTPVGRFTAGHGAAVARVLCEASGGAADIVSIPVLDERAEGTTLALANGIVQATPAGGAGVELINLSLGFPEDPTLGAAPPHVVDAILWAGAQGAELVAAAGNRCNPMGGADDAAACAPFYPAALSGRTLTSSDGTTTGPSHVLAVGGVRDATPKQIEEAAREGRQISVVASFLGDQGTIDLYAPSEVLSEARGTQARCPTRSGTSFAAPQVTGAAALLRSAALATATLTAKPSAQAVLGALVQHADPRVERLEGIPTCPDQARRPGLLDVCAAATTLGVLPSCTRAPVQEIDPSPDCVTTARTLAPRVPNAKMVTLEPATLSRPAACNVGPNPGTAGQGTRWLSTGGSSERDNGSQTDAILNLDDLEAGYQDYVLVLDCGGPLKHVVIDLDAYLSSYECTGSTNPLSVPIGPIVPSPTGGPPYKCDDFDDIQSIYLFANNKCSGQSDDPLLTPIDLDF